MKISQKKFCNYFLWIAFFSCLFFPAAAGAKNQLTPILTRVLAPPQAVLGSDGAYHLVYEILLTNASKSPWTLSEIHLMQQAPQIKELKTISGKQVSNVFSDLAERKPGNTLAAGQSGLLFLTLSFNAKNAVPEEITHRLDFTFQDRLISQGGPSIKVILKTPTLIASPLHGERWLAGDGCCESQRHVRAALPIDGDLHLAQRYAIDWEKLNKENRIFTGDPKKVESYFCYGQEVYAVADGKVVAAVDGLPDQIPGKLPDHMELSQADGNHVVLEIAPGVFALYAHLKKGSLQVHQGDTVKTGQTLGHIGNSGNTSEPHLHFHLMDSPSPLASDGLPYLIQSFQVLGRAPSTQAFDEAASQGFPLKILGKTGPKTHLNELPLDLSLVNFP